MIKYFDKKNILFYKLLFPYRKIRQSTPMLKKESVVVGIGGNMGDTYWIFKKVFNRFKKHNKIRMISSSPVLQNPAFGFLEQKYFLNAVLVLETTMKVREFLKYILNMEKSLGRVRSFKNAPRVIDIDIIFFKNQKTRKKNLIIPHIGWRDRLSVILPLSTS